MATKRNFWQKKTARGWPAIRPRRDWRRRISLGSAKGRPRDAEAQDARLHRVEAVLFVAREPLTSRKLAQFAGLLDGTEARTLIRRLNQAFDAVGSAFRVEEVAGGFQLMTRAKFSPWLRRLFTAPVETRLSAPAMETLAIVAYRQPVLRADVDAIRGVDCGEILRQLMERDLVRITGRSDDLGRPYLYGTTKRFLQIFGLRHLDDLPRAGILRQQNPAVADSSQSNSADPVDTADSHDVHESASAGLTNI